MATSYRHFDHKERTLIYWWRKEQVSLREIPRRLKRSHTSISRELRRKLWCGQHYYPRGGSDDLYGLHTEPSETRSIKIKASPGVWIRVFQYDRRFSRCGMAELR